MKIKEGANIQGLHIRMRPVLKAADKIWDDLGEELVITAGLDGEHSAGSLHYYGRAVDMRTRYFDEYDKEEAANLLRRDLGEDYDVIEHTTHIHVEFDPKLEPNVRMYDEA